jgi:hypothetical protein
MIKICRSSKPKCLSLPYIENPNIKTSDSEKINVSYIARLPICLNIKHKLVEMKLLEGRVRITKFLKQFKNSFIYLGSEP